MARKKQQQKKRLKKYQGKYVTADRLDMSKGGRVGYQKGKRVRDLRDPSGKTFYKPGEVPDMKVGNQQPRNNQPAKPVENRAATKQPTGSVLMGTADGPLPQFDASKKQPPMSVGGVGGSGNVDLDEQFGAVGGETTQEPVTPTQPTPEPASPEIMRETTPPNTTFTTTNEQGEQVTLPNMADWEKEWLKNNPRPPKGGGAVGQKRRVEWENKFNVAKEQHQADLDNATVTFPTTTTEQQKAAFEDARRERIRETGLQIEAASTGQVPEGAIIPDAEKVTGEIPQEVTTMAEPTKATELLLKL